jgi:transcriptional regulator with XRE-family HTH domain
MTIKKTKRKESVAMKLLEDLSGGPLTLAELLGAIRIGEQMTHTQFAKELGISRSHLCDIEKGRKSVSLIRAVEFAEIMGYSKDQFARLALQSMINEAGLPFRVSLAKA